MIKNIFIITLFSFLSTFAFSQTYKVDTFYTEYKELQDYHSLTKELIRADIDEYFWDLEFDLGFDFPYFDTTIQTIWIQSDLNGSTSEEGEYIMSFFSGQYSLFPILDIDNLVSEHRYGVYEENGVKIFKIEFYNNTIWYNAQWETNPNVNDFLNIQLWFYETGTIEIRFGNSHFSESKYYSETDGLIFPFDPVKGETYGPYIIILDDQEQKGYSIQGNLREVENPTAFYPKVPKEGYVVRFEYQKETPTTNIQKQKIGIYPTLVRNSVNIKSESKDVFSTITDINGRVILESNSRNIDVASLVSGIYFIQVKTGDDVESFKFSKI